MEKQGIVYTIHGIVRRKNCCETIEKYTQRLFRNGAVLHQSQWNDRIGASKMDSYDTISDLLVNLFNEIMDIEEKAIITEEFQDITNNDMHIIAAIGIDLPRKMTAGAKTLSVTVGTLTIAVNNLVKKGYVTRARSVEDRRVVLISLTEKGRRAYFHHEEFHKKMVKAVLKELNDDQVQVLVKALMNLREFFCSFK